MSEFETNQADELHQSAGSMRKWLLSCVVLVLFGIVSVAAYKWQQPIRGLIEGLEIEADAERNNLLELQTNDQSIEMTEIEEPPEQYAINSPPLLERIISDVPDVVFETDDTLKQQNRDPDELSTIAKLPSAESVADTRNAVTTLNYDKEDANQNEARDQIFGVLTKAINNVHRNDSLKVAAVRERIERLSDEVIQLVVIRDTLSPDFQYLHTSQNEASAATGFWGQVSNGLGSVYKVRRIEPDSTIEPLARENIVAPIRSLMLLERARTALDHHDVNAYRDALVAASSALESFLDDSSPTSSAIYGEISSLLEVELVSEEDAIRQAFRVLNSSPQRPVEDFEIVE